MENLKASRQTQRKQNKTKFHADKLWPVDRHFVSINDYMHPDLLCEKCPETFKMMVWSSLK